MNLSQYKTYFENAAKHHVSVQHTDVAKHFSTIYLDEALSFSKNLMFPCFLLELPENRPVDNLADNIRQVKSGALLILKKVATPNQLDIITAYEEMEVIADDMISKLLNDRKKANQSGIASPESLMKHLDVNSIRAVEVGPIFDNYYGWRLEFQINTPKNYTLDESKWLAGTETIFNYRD